MSGSDVPIIPAQHDEDEWIVIEPGTEYSALSVPPYAGADTPSGSADGEDPTTIPQSLPASAPQSAVSAKRLVVPAPWDGDDRTLVGTVGTVAAASPTAWSGEDRTTVPVSAGNPATATARSAPWIKGAQALDPLIDASQSYWEGEDRTTVPQSAGVWSGGERTSVPAAPSALSAREPAVPTRSDRLRTAKGANKPDTAWLTGQREGPLTGQRLGDFDIGGIIGEGGMGLVYRARQLSLNRRVALKVLAENLASDDGLVRRFFSEAHAASVIQSPHVVQVIFAGEIMKTVFYAMEFVEGCDLYAVVREARANAKNLDPLWVAQALAQAARGLQAAGEQDIVHRDIKPQNLLLSGEGVVKIADFGIAKCLGENSLTLAGQIIGTPMYFSPEQGRGQPVDHRSDLYSLGVVLYEMLTGIKPFVGGDANTLIYQHNYVEPKLLRALNPAIPEALEAVCMRLLQKDPERRFQHAEEVAHLLSSIGTGHQSGELNWSPSLGTGAQAAFQRDHGGWKRWLWPAVAAAGVLVIGVTLWLWLLVGNSAERDEIARHRAALEILDRVESIPASASSDLRWLARKLGNGDADVQRWRLKLARVSAVEERLRVLDVAGDLSSERYQQARADLAAYQADSGVRGPLVERWRMALGSYDVTLSELRGELAAIDAAPPLPKALIERCAALLNRYGSMVVADDPALLRWRQILIKRTTEVQTLGASLARLDLPDTPLTAVLAATLSGDLARLVALEGDDLQTRTWRTRLEIFAAELTALRARLARLDRVEQVTIPLAQELSADLVRHGTLVDVGDPSQAGWESKVAAVRQKVAALRGSLGTTLNGSRGLSAAELSEASRSLVVYRALVSGDDGSLAVWERRLAHEQADVDALRTLAVCLDGKQQLVQADCRAAAAAVEQLASRGFAATVELAGWRRRLAEEQTASEQLRVALRAYATSGSLHTDDAAQLVVRLSESVGTDDAEVKELATRRMAVLRLRQRLILLDAVQPAPEDLPSLLANYIQLVPPDQVDLVRWQDKAARIDALTTRLMALDGSGRPLNSATADLASLRALVGSEDARVKRWAAHLVSFSALGARLAAILDHVLVLTAPEKTAADLDAWTALVGVSDVDSLRWREQLIQLLGPPVPAWVSTSGRDTHGPWIAITVRGVTVRLRHIPAGDTHLGSPESEAGRKGDEHQVMVRLSASYWMAETEVTQALWTAVMGSNPSQFLGNNKPVESISRSTAEDFCRRLSGLLPGATFRLPSAAEWEHACHAGDAGPWLGPAGPVAEAQLAEVAWFGHSDGTREVALLLPNRLGLFDMHGNVWEWCADSHGPPPAEGSVDPLGRRGTQAEIRGGSWADEATSLRAANRVGLDPSARSRMVGLRLTCTAAWSLGPRMTP